MNSVVPNDFEIEEFSTPAVWAPMQQVGRYTLLSLLGRGGMGEVWLAQVRGPQDFTKLFAVKRVVATLSDDLDSVNMLGEEARICAMLQHPNIIPIFEFGEHAGVSFFAMEFVSGDHLGMIFKVLETDPFPLPMYHRVAIIREIVSALSYAHTLKDPLGTPLNLVHRDVSPSNIIVTPEGQVKLLDFGVARADSRRHQTQGGRIKGKLHYMSLEQLTGKEIDGRADQFALGVVFAEFLAGRRSQETSLADATPAGFVGELLNGLPEETSPVLRSTIARMLSAEAEHRFPTMNDVDVALRTWLDESPRPTLSLSQALKSGMRRQIERREKLLEFVQRQSLASSSSGFSDGRQVPATITAPQRAVATPSLPSAVQADPSSRSGEVSRSLSMQSMQVAAFEQQQKPRWWLYAIPALLVLAVGVLWWATSRSSATEPTPIALVTVPADTEAVPATKPATPSEPQMLSTKTTQETSPATAATSESSDKKKSTAAKTPVKAGPTGQLSLQTTPWTQVYFGNRLLGETPLVNVALPVGTHRLRLVNEESSISTTIEVVIEAKKKTVKTLKL
jgi:eukaryotic-like serine/threonine-protein kinase